MTKKLIALGLILVCAGFGQQVDAQTNKNKKSRYYQNSTQEEEFNVQGFYRDEDKKEVDEKQKEDEYDVKVRRNESEGKYTNEKRVIEREERQEEAAPARPRREPRTKSYPTTYGSTRNYNDNRSNYDRYYTGPSTPPPAPVEAPPPPPPAPRAPRRVKSAPKNDREVKMTSAENEYKTTYVKKRYTNLDVLCDDLDLAKIQRPVFKGICTECSRDVDAIIQNKNLSNLEKNYQLKNCYMLRDKRLRETLDDDQYKKWLRIKDADEYLVLTKDSELKDGVNK
jgi:hypothetical protein